MPKHVDKEQKVKASKDKPETETQTHARIHNTSRSDAVKAEIDSILDEIDSVLEKNAQEFVDSYVQKGGE
jgi:ubiquitin-like protein Pup